jgi:tetratricopeptide (TPR) repeat protein
MIGIPRALLVMLTGLAVSDAGAQEFRWPDEPENLQVLPEGAKGLELGQLMRGYAISLGVRCDHCHVGEGSDLTQYDFAADDKLAKQKARVMIEMLATLNATLGPKLTALDEQGDPPLTVTCITCHRKNARPVMLEDVLTDALRSGGITAAVGKYRELRDEFYGGFAFDFSAGALSRLGELLARERDFDAAIRLAELDIEMNGESASLYWSLGNIQERAKLVPDAIESYRSGLAIAPDDWKTFFEDKLRRLEPGLQF